jgi:hypothetical protein
MSVVQGRKINPSRPDPGVKNRTDVGWPEKPVDQKCESGAQKKQGQEKTAHFILLIE